MTGPAWRLATRGRAGRETRTLSALVVQFGAFGRFFG